MKNNIDILYSAHVADIGWQEEVKNGFMAGTVGEHRPLEALRINSIDLPNTNIDAYAWVQDYGESGIRDQNGNVVEGNHLGEDIGSTGLSKHAEAFRIGLIGDGYNTHDIWYRVHVEDIGWMNFAKNGEWSGTIGGNKQVEAIQIWVVSKNEPFFTYDNENKFIDLTPAPTPAIIETEDQKRRRIVEHSNKYVGYLSNNGYSDFGARYGDPYGDYCAFYDMTVFDDAGLSELCPPTGYCPYAVDWFLQHEEAYFFRPFQYTPKFGDIIYFDFGGGKNGEPNGIADHTGIVEGCDGVTVCTNEGNTGTPNGVKRKYYSVNNPYILGYGVPCYSE